MKIKKLTDWLNVFPFPIYLNIFPESGMSFKNNTLLELLSCSIFTEINYDQSVKGATHCRRSRSRAIKNFAKFTEKLLYWSLFLIKLQGSSLPRCLARDSLKILRARSGGTLFKRCLVVEKVK